MRMRIADAKCAYLSQLEPGTLVRPGSSAYTGRFRAAMVVGLDNGNSGVWRGLLALDGPDAMTVFVSDDPIAVRVLPHTQLLVEGIDDLDERATKTARGALTIRSGGAPLVRVQIDGGTQGYVDLGNGHYTRLDSEELRESFLSWTLVAIDANSKSEEVIAVGPSTPSP